MSSVYIGMTIDVLHHGHINVIEHARQYGDVIIGLLTDAAVADHKRLPCLTYEQRKKIIENICGVTRVVPQEEWDYAPNLRRYRPDFMVHGDDWLEGPLAPYRQKAMDALEEYGGKLIEIPGLDHGAGHFWPPDLPYGSPRWTEGSRRYLDRC
jgi:phosphoenolpyruvate phosphomutase